MAKQSRIYYLTTMGKRELLRELSDIKKEIPSVARELTLVRNRDNGEDTIDFATLSDRLDFLNKREIELEEILRKFQPIGSPTTKSKVSLGHRVKLLRQRTRSARWLKLVGSLEANPTDGRISNECPLGQELIGKTIGETVEIATSTGAERWVVLSIA